MVPASVTLYDCAVCGLPLFLEAGIFHHLRHHPQDHDAVVILVILTRDAS